MVSILMFLLFTPFIKGEICSSDKECGNFIKKPWIAIAVFFYLVALVALVDIYLKKPLLDWFNRAVLVIVVVFVFCFTIFAFAVTNKSAGQVVGNRGYKEYKLGNYSHWLQKRLDEASNWNKIGNSIHCADICHNLGKDDAAISASDFYNKHLTPIQSGCCKPPTACNFTFVNATYWTGIPDVTIDEDCGSWSNNQDQLCYNCNSCKAGVIAHLKNDWRKISILIIFMLIVWIIMLIVSIIVCSILCRLYCSTPAQGNKNSL